MKIVDGSRMETFLEGLDADQVFELNMKFPIRSLTPLFLLIGLVNCLKWPFSSFATLAPGPSHSSAAELSISQLEKDTVFQNLDPAGTFNTGSDCFRDAIGQLNVRCEEMETRHDARVDAAISMTLCELHTTEQVPVPMECRPYVRSLSTSPESAKGCVEALYRSPQLWSSYSGYLRQIPQLCFAYLRWHDIDTAKRIYQNATVEKIALLRLLKRRHEDLHNRETRLNDGLEHLEEIEGKLMLSVNSFGAKSDLVLDGFRDSWQQAQREVVVVHDRFNQIINEQVKAHGEQLSLVTRRAEEQHANALHSLLADTSHSLAQMKETLSRLSSHAGSLSLITKDAQEEWPKLQVGIVTFTKALLVVNTAMEHIALKMESQADVVENLTSKQEHVSRQLTSLSDSLSQISSVAKSHIEDMNATALAIRQNLIGKRRGSTLEWMLHGAYHLLPLLNRMDLTYLHQLSSHPAAGISLFALRLVWSLLSSVLSFLASSFLVFLSTRFLIRKSHQPKPLRGPRFGFLSSILPYVYPTSIASSTQTQPASRVTFSNDLPVRQRRPQEDSSKMRSSRLTRAVSAPPLRMI